MHINYNIKLINLYCFKRLDLDKEIKLNFIEQLIVYRENLNIVKQQLLIYNFN